MLSIILLFWCQQWKMNVNLGKTKVVQFQRTSCEVRKLEFMFNFEALEINCLGLIIDI